MPIPSEGWVHKSPRPLMMWLTVMAVAICIFVIAALCFPLWRAINRWADGQPLDWGGAATMLTALGTLLLGVLRAGGSVFNARAQQRLEEIRGGQVATPFSPSPDEPAINPHGGPDAP